MLSVVRSISLLIWDNLNDFSLFSSLFLFNWCISDISYNSNLFFKVFRKSIKNIVSVAIFSKFLTAILPKVLVCVCKLICGICRASTNNRHLRMPHKVYKMIFSLT